MTSGGKRNPANAETGGDQDGRVVDLIEQACPDQATTNATEPARLTMASTAPTWYLQHPVDGRCLNCASCRCEVADCGRTATTDYAAAKIDRVTYSRTRLPRSEVDQRYPPVVRGGAALTIDERHAVGPAERRCRATTRRDLAGTGQAQQAYAW
jgi:hypothetical protein